MREKVNPRVFNNEFPKIIFKSWFYRNCKKQRKNKAKICQECPFRKGIEIQEIDFIQGEALEG